MQLFTVILGLLGMLALPGLRRDVRGTTLLAPLYWALASGFAVLVVAIQGANEPLVNYAAAVTTLLPAAAIYGAKRPQDRGWQWIVAALLIMLLWPAGESWLLGHPFQLAAQPLRSWFLVVLLAVQLGNWIVTTNAGPVFLLTAAQTALLWPQLPWVDRSTDAQTWFYGAALLAVVPWWLVYILRRQSRLLEPEVALTFPAPSELADWKWFRAAYGVVWALRVTERINEVAKLRHWGWHWSWSGPLPNENIPPAKRDSLTTSLNDIRELAAWHQLWENIFRRFLRPRNSPSDQATEIDSQ